MMLKKYIFSFFLLLLGQGSCFENSKFVVLICSYNNEKWVEKNIASAIDQKYKNFRIIYVNDASTDSTYVKLDRFLEDHPKKDKIHVINNISNKGALRNIYETVHQHINDDEIVCLLDGDDFFINDKVLSFLDKVYQNKKKECWMTYGQYKGSSSGVIGHCRNYSRKNKFRDQPFLCSHLRTFYAWLFKRININDLKDNEIFFNVAWDVAIMLPLIEMAHNHYAFIHRILYLYNEDNPISDFRIKHEKQIYYEKLIFSKPPYPGID
jgi:glycosyltransferase involved in cell wall biosynthesis